ncbi:(E)-4-hydroxy-3-methylbut-2-enyl-diphosphate synthase [Actomonas aquatica]|uniref:4-hydroxy-3-methylbut-2-en-1-yl diphosphate synthase (flavodoxin) n=1 Tax=Actomonas aquatica TaxID=2866162 RepID=A0ABZ1C6X0_9BACT|nr:(E)-4-hydroxy-3-methylbut-2-enyl-diphosphate synthase [Opitutus sp. WL0086]WRQ87385.1 (E)-4-hydroxy-3-methylbut-2-enyl-diphosphate synthase [Opitutus sp. WL0086]
MSSYCASRFRTLRRASTEVFVGGIGVGGSHPLRVQSMTTTNTQDVAATVKQAIALAEVGCEIVRVTAPNKTAARALKDIRAQFSAAGFAHVPLVADIHFLPSAAMEAVEHVEKIRVNPGNYADKKKFAVTEYSDAAYNEELERLHEAFSPLVKRAKELGRAMRIGTNHGSLSDRIMNRYGDSPLGMVESALEFLRIAESHDYHAIMLSMKASNPKVMIEAYRLLVQRMAEENMHYPLHLGVTEAGDGEDGRIKSAIGIGSLLLDGLGDTLRVSLTEDPVYEIPVARALAAKAQAMWRDGQNIAADRFPIDAPDPLDPFHFQRRDITDLALAPDVELGREQPPRVIVRAPSVAKLPDFAAALRSPSLKDNPPEGLLVPIADASALAELGAQTLETPSAFLGLELGATLTPDDLRPTLDQARGPLLLVREVASADLPSVDAWQQLATSRPDTTLALSATPAVWAELAPHLATHAAQRVIATVSIAATSDDRHAIGAYRDVAATLRTHGLKLPLWIRNTTAARLTGEPDFLSRLLDASILTGSLLCDGLGDLMSIETEPDAVRAVKLAYNVLQGAGARITKTEFVACPSCGRTLFDLQSTTQRIREKTGHLKGVKIAIMGCIVNGPGEMADADFGYVGGAPGKINLYVGKTCVQYNIPQKDADNRLIDLIREHGKWVDSDT